jgi:hypothetical protein
MRRRTKIAVIGALVCVVPTVAIVVVMRLRPEPLSNGCLSCGDAERPIEPHLAASEGGRMAVAWMAQEREGRAAGGGGEGSGGGEEDEGAKAIFVRTSLDSGATWKRRKSIEVPEHFLADPTVALGRDGDLDVAFLGFKQNVQKHGDPYEMNVYVAHNFEKARAVGDFGNSTYDKPWSARANDGALIVAYRFQTSTTAGIAAFRVDQKGGATTQRVIDGPSSSAALPVLCASADSADVYLAYVDASPGVFVRHSPDWGLTWPADDGARVSAPNDKVALEGPSCAASGHNVVLSYGTSKEPWKPTRSAMLDAIVVATSDDAGHTWKLARITDGQPFMHPAVAGTSLAYVGADGVRAITDLPRFVASAVDGKAGAPPPGPPLLPSRLVAPRSEDAWTGDYFGAAVSKETLCVAAVDNTGPPRLFFKKP